MSIYHTFIISVPGTFREVIHSQDDCGGIRADIVAGDITYKDMIKVFPFSNKYASSPHGII